ncbi:MAG: hypothetical protein HY815_15145 [Candidatus Riflebacteria bacterium]|nr:hypothetical protein [Candidatus Riflebacteria bacterium]
MSRRVPVTIARHWPLTVALVLAVVTLGALFSLCLARTGGEFAYAIDDPYIHMAMAKNFARHGVWGVTRHEFTSSSSAIGWTLLVSGIYRFVGIRDLVPLALNILFVVALLWMIHRRFDREPRSFGPTGSLVLLVGVFFLTPLPALVFTGQEHVLHTLLTVVFVTIAGGALATGSAPRSLLVLAAALPTVRCEALFLVLLTCLLFLARGRKAYSIGMGCCAVLPLAIYGAISVAHGWLPLATPIVLKGNLADLGRAGQALSLSPGQSGPAAEALSRLGAVARLLGLTAAMNLLAAPHLLMLILAALIVPIIRVNEDPSGSLHVELGLFVGSTMLHLQFARTGWFYRYEAYLVALGLVVLARPAADAVAAIRQRLARDGPFHPGPAAALALSVLVALPLFARGAQSLVEVPGAARNVFEQHCQMGRFLERFYEGRAVAANDVGAINYIADVRCLDLVGLATREVWPLKRRRSFDRTVVAALARRLGVAVAVVYDRWLLDPPISGVPPGWKRIGQWSIRDRVSAAQETVSWYATVPEEERRLAENLAAFSSRLPRSVLQTGDYLGVTAR